MPQMHFYVREEVAKEIRERAQDAGLSTSRFLAALVERELVTEWPEGFFEEVIGGWQGEPLERAPQGEYEVRDQLDPGL